MKLLPLSILLMTVLTGCMSSLAEVRRAPVDRSQDFIANTADLSYCVHQAIQGLDTGFTFLLSGSPDQREFFITATRMENILTMNQGVGMELHFLTHGQVTTVELRKGAIAGWRLDRETWPLIEPCSRQLLFRLATDADKSR